MDPCTYFDYFSYGVAKTYTRQNTRATRMIEAFMNVPKQSDTMADAAIVPLKNILKKTPPGQSADELPTFVLSDAIAVFEDGSYANMLADHADRKVFIQGRVMCDIGNEVHFISKNQSGSLIKEEFTGLISHATGHLTLWVGIQEKWFEINPAEGYRPIFDRMIHVLGIYWANDTFVDAGGKSEKLLHAEYAQTSFVMIVCHYAEKVNGGPYFWQSLLEMVDECGLWLKNQCMLQRPRFENTPLVLWLGDSEHTLADLGSEIADVAREMFAVRPSSVFPNGIEDFTDIVHVTHAVAMYCLEKKGLKGVTLAGVSFEVDRICSTGTAQAAASFMIHSRHAILSSFPAELADSRLHAELQNPDPLHDLFRTVKHDKDKTKNWAGWLKSGEKLLVRRKERPRGVKPENNNEDESDSDSDVLMSAWNAALRDNSNREDGYEPFGKDGELPNQTNLLAGGYHRGQMSIHESLVGSNFLPASVSHFTASGHIADFNSSTRPAVAVNPHLAHLTSFGDGSAAANRFSSGMEIDGEEEGYPPFAAKGKRIKRVI